MIVSRYLTREVLATLAVVTVALLLVTIGGRFIGYLADAAAGQFPARVLLWLLVYRLPEFLQLLLPFAFLVSVLLAFGRMGADHESTVLQASGMSDVARLRITLVISLWVAVPVATLSLVVTPQSRATLDSLVREEQVLSPFELLVPGRFQALHGRARVAHVDSVSDDRTELGGVFVAERGPSLDIIVVAHRGIQYVNAATGSRYLMLERGRRYEGRPGEGGYRVAVFERLGQRVDRPAMAVRNESVESQTIGALLASREIDASAELDWRVGLVMMVFLAAAMGVSFARVGPQQSRFGGLVPGVSLFVAYYLLLGAAREGVADGNWPASSLWLIHAAVTVALLGVSGWRRWVPARQRSSRQ